MTASEIIRQLKSHGATVSMSKDFRVLIHGKDREELPRKLVLTARANIEKLRLKLLDDYGVKFSRAKKGERRCSPASYEFVKKTVRLTPMTCEKIDLLADKLNLNTSEVIELVFRAPGLLDSLIQKLGGDSEQ